MILIPHLRALTWALLGLLLLPAVIHAQSITSYTANIYQGAEGPATTPLRTQVFPASEVTCNLAPEVAPLPAKTIFWDDPSNAGRRCRWTETTTNLFTGLAAANYRGGLRFTNATGTGPESPLSPFTVTAPPLPLPGAPTGVVFRP
jgi:hypothetical protein